MISHYFSESNSQGKEYKTYLCGKCTVTPWIKDYADADEDDRKIKERKTRYVGHIMRGEKLRITEADN